MCTPIEDQLRRQLKEEQEKNENLEVRLELLSDFTEDFTQQINRSVMAENHMLTEKSHAINNLLNDWYEAIDENYTERLENDDELDIVRAKSELDLITKILDEVEKL